MRQEKNKITALFISLVFAFSLFGVGKGSADNNGDYEKSSSLQEEAGAFDRVTDIEVPAGFFVSHKNILACPYLSQNDILDIDKGDKVDENKVSSLTDIPNAHDPVMSENDTETEAEENFEENFEANENTEGEQVSEKGIEETYLDDGIILDVPYINQRVNFPNGCESVSAVMALKYLGIEIDPHTFIENYLDMGRSLYFENGENKACDPREQFPGDPRDDSGWGCYPEVIKKAVDKMGLKNIRAVVLKDASLDTLCKEYIDRKIPVVFWGTIDMASPSEWLTWRINDGSERTHTWISPFHCVLLVGYDSDNYYFNDPWRQKNRAYSRSSVEIAYSGLGREALVILEN